MSIRYAVLATTGINDPSKVLKCADESPVYWETFADAKAEVIARAEVVLDYLVSSERDYELHFESGDHHYEVWFEYGPASSGPSLPFKTALQVYKCTVLHGQVEEVEL